MHDGFHAGKFVDPRFLPDTGSRLCSRCGRLRIYVDDSSKECMLCVLHRELGPHRRILFSFEHYRAE